MSALVIAKRRRLGAAVGAVALCAVGLAPAVASHAAAADRRAAPSKARVSFGAHVTKHTQPSNAFSGQSCQPSRSRAAG